MPDRSIPIPDGVLQTHHTYWGDEEIVVVKDLPKLYEAWAESRKEAVAMQLAAVAGDDCFTFEAELPGQAEQNSVGREAWRRQARDVLALGLGERS